MNASKGLTLYDGIGFSPGNRVTQPLPGGKAVLNLHNGRKFVFEVI